jgi:hypothetical protein
MDSTTTRRMPLRRARRVRLNVTLDPSTKRYLRKLGEGNCSAAIEELVSLERLRQETAPILDNL